MGVVISSNYTLSSPGADTPLSHARVGYLDNVAAGTVTPSTETAGFEADSIQNGFTFEAWKPTALPANVVVDFGSNKTIGYIGIAAHTLGSDGASLVAEYSTDDVIYTTLGVNTSPTDDGALLLLFDEVTARYIKLTVSGSTIPTIGVVYCGQTLDMYRPFYRGHSPGPLSRDTEAKPNKSEGGHFIGRSVIRSGLKVSYAWRHTPIDWYEANVEPLSLAARTRPFFVAWNPSEHPGHVVYGWTSDDIKPTLMGVRNLVEFGFEFEGFDAV